MSSNNSLNNAVEFVVSAYEAGTKGKELVGVANTAARKYHVKSVEIQEGVRTFLKEKPVETKIVRPLSPAQQALREYNEKGFESFSEYEPVARPDVKGLKVPKCPKCEGVMHAFFSRKGEEFWGCCSRKCDGIRKLLRPMTEEEAMARDYAPYLK